MKSLFFALATALATGVYGQSSAPAPAPPPPAPAPSTPAPGGSMTINTPSNVVVCQPVLLTWTGGTPPYDLTILPGGEPNGNLIEDLGKQNGTSLTWVANIAAGTSIGFTLRDNVGLIAQTAPVNVLSGSDTSCVGKSPSSGAAPPNTAGVTPSAAPATTTAPATTGAASGTTTKPATSATAGASKPSSTNAARPTQAIQIGAAGVVGAAILALLA